MTNATKKPGGWSAVRQQLATWEEAALLALVKDLYEAAGVNRDLIHARCKAGECGGERVWANQDGTISTSLRPGRHVEVEPLLFQNMDGDGMLAFREGSHGRITNLFSDSWPYAYERVWWYQTPSFHMGLLGVTALLFLSAFLAGLVRSLRHRPPSEGAVSRMGRGAWALAGLVGALNLLFVAALFITAGGTPEGGIGESTYGVPPVQVALLTIPVLTAALAAVMLVLTASAWRRRWWSVFGRIHYSLVTLAALAFVWFADYWNLLGFRF